MLEILSMQQKFTHIGPEKLASPLNFGLRPGLIPGYGPSCFHFSKLIALNKHWPGISSSRLGLYL